MTRICGTKQVPPGVGVTSQLWVASEDEMARPSTCMKISRQRLNIPPPIARPCHTCIAMHTESIWVPEGRPIHLHKNACNMAGQALPHVFTADGVN